MVEKSSEEFVLQGSIDLSREIELIANSIFTAKVDVKDVRKHRKLEI